MGVEYIVVLLDALLLVYALGASEVLHRGKINVMGVFVLFSLSFYSLEGLGVERHGVGVFAAK